MSDTLIIYFSVALGVAISVALPILKQMLPKPKKVEGLSRSDRSKKIWRAIKPYFITGLFSLIVAVIIVALLGDVIGNWQNGFLAGYTADSTLQKLTTGGNDS